MLLVKSTDVEEDNEEEDNVEKEEQERQPRKKQKNLYDPFSKDPTPLATGRCRRSRTNCDLCCY